MNLKDGFCMPITVSERDFTEHFHDWDDAHSKEPQDLDLNLGEIMNVLSSVFSLPEPQDDGRVK